MSPRNALLTTLLVALALASPLRAHEEGTLHFPPKLESVLTAWSNSDAGDGDYSVVKEITIYEYGSHRDLSLLSMLFFDAGR